MAATGPNLHTLLHNDALVRLSLEAIVKWAGSVVNISDIEVMRKVVKAIQATAAGTLRELNRVPGGSSRG